MKVSDMLVWVYSMATDSPQFKDAKGTPNGKEAIKLMKQLYKEVLAVENEGKKFDGEDG